MLDAGLILVSLSVAFVGSIVALLDNLSKRVVVPALKRCSVCGEAEAKHEADHEFKLDESIPKWAGWYSLRRGVATTLAGLTKDGMASKGPVAAHEPCNHNTALCEGCA